MKIKTILGAIAALCFAATNASAVNIYLNESSAPGKVHYDLGGGLFATLIGLQTDAPSLDGVVVEHADLVAAAGGGSVSFYYAAGNALSVMFDNVVEFTPFVQDELSEVGYKKTSAWDSLWIVYDGNLVVSDSSGTNTISTVDPQQAPVIRENPFAKPVPDTGATLMMLGLSFLGLVGARKRFAR
ncbi:VPDSG-CTERM sorting domain-containing protein [Pelagicoccus mobilis]|uniref:VPDSG-CTERM sorting domain-containing protein n=1 Tax=Pelagicoccus mobilis TaxID=415221 RepID=A0A934RU96_9BACT|nr:VPDSG-CTERM sorting domain-containing protein [Pelagicoccus mobilis]MBK1876538.1 VPDSG-CTERM sorting domain-containing protein [Pelagicoccus mobilis]